MIFSVRVCDEVEEELVNDQLVVEVSSNPGMAEGALVGGGGMWMPNMADSNPEWKATLLDAPIENCRIVSFSFTVTNVEQVDVGVVYRQAPGSVFFPETARVSSTICLKLLYHLFFKVQTLL